jgi:hypothetical protein
VGGIAARLIMLFPAGFHSWPLTAITLHWQALKARYPQIEICQFDLEDTNIWGFADDGFDIVIVANYLYRPRLDDLLGLVRPGGYLAYETFATGNEVFGRPSNPDFLLQDGRTGRKTA